MRRTIMPYPSETVSIIKHEESETLQIRTNKPSTPIVSLKTHQIILKYKSQLI